MSAAIVAGAGVSGLTSAVRLLEAGFRVRVLARERTPSTTSDVAAAVWYPFRCGRGALALAWARESYEEFRTLARDGGAGVTMASGLDLHEPGEIHDTWWHGAVDPAPHLVTSALPSGFDSAHAFTAPVITMPLYLAWLETRVIALGGRLESRTIDALAPLLSEAPLVVNCTGLGAKDLVDDDDLHPIRGQIVRVAPGRTERFVQAASADRPTTYVIPRPDCTVLGGTTDVGDWSLAVDSATADEILARCTAVVPELAGAAVLSHAVGLRPGRSEVRLAAETTAGGVIVHNYGHGGAGVTLSWGCAAEVRRVADAAFPGR